MERGVRAPKHGESLGEWMRSSCSSVAERLQGNPQGFWKTSALLLLSVAAIALSACGKKEPASAAMNTDYVDLLPDRCPEGKRIYPGREGRFCSSGSLTNFSI